MSRTAALLTATLLVAACGGDGTVLTTTTGPATTTTAAPTTTLDSATSTTAAATTTSAPEATTITGPHEEPILFLPDGLGLVTFGMSPIDTIATMVTFIGPPTNDTGWVNAFENFGVCPGPNARMVSWGELHLLFTDEGPFPGGGEQFFSYQYLGGDPGPTPGPPQSVDAGVTLDQVLDIWPTAVVMEGDEFFPPNFRAEEDLGELLYATLTGVSGADTVIDIYGGYGCGE
jgi:hypothetical protein